MGPQLEKSTLTDIFTGDRPDGKSLSLIHFALPCTSEHAKVVHQGQRRATLLYTSQSRGAYCMVEGTLAVVHDPELRRHYWRKQWADTLPRSIDTALAVPPKSTAFQKQT